ncbi:MAG: hypothetical protein J6X95_09010 [Treponema sp.]|nr:hypothetical protein [Treponema sp.]
MERKVVIELQNVKRYFQVRVFVDRDHTNVGRAILVKLVNRLIRAEHGIFLPEQSERLWIIVNASD